MPLIFLTVLFVSGCDYGPRFYECLPSEQAAGEIALDIVAQQWPDLQPVTERMDVFCKEKLVYDVDAYTMRIGSAIVRGRMFVRDGVPVGNAVLHEGMHWSTWDQGGCPKHAKTCWNDRLLEKMQKELERRRTSRSGGYVITPGSETGFVAPQPTPAPEAPEQAPPYYGDPPLRDDGFPPSMLTMLRFR